jgi:hypothetical protein
MCKIVVAIRYFWWQAASQEQERARGIKMARSEEEISALEGAFAEECRATFDEFVATFIAASWREVGGTEEDLCDFNLDLKALALAELGYVSADDVAATLRDIVKKSEETRYLAVERLRKMGLKP